jgi:hypothetical protein
LPTETTKISIETLYLACKVSHQDGNSTAGHDEDAAASSFDTGVLADDDDNR